MLLTEQEAKECWCCGHLFVAVATLALNKNSEIADPKAFGRCVGSACMAWRRTKKRVVHNSQTGVVRDVEELTCIDKKHEHIEEVFSDLGYCGIAGKVEGN